MKRVYQDLLPSLAIFSLLYSGSCVLAQPAEGLPPNLQVVIQRESNVNDGLIVEILQDPQGFVWMTTDMGLVRFDGQNEKRFLHDQDNPHSIDDNTTYHLLLESRGHIWVSTNSGLNRLDPQTGQFSHWKHDPEDPLSISDNRVSTAHEDGRGTLWFGTYLGLNEFDRESDTFIRYQFDDIGPIAGASNAIRAIREDSRGILWIGTMAGIMQIDPVRNLVVPWSRNPGENEVEGVWDIFGANDQSIWISTSMGLFQFDPGTDRTLNHILNINGRPIVPQPKVTAFAETEGGYLWLGTHKQGLYLFKPGTGILSHWNTSNSELCANSITSLYHSRLQPEVLWITTLNGLNKALVRKRNFLHLTAASDNSHSISDSYVMSIIEDKNGDAWLGTINGLNRYTPATGECKNWRYQNGEANTLSAKGILSLYQDEDGILWIGTFFAGLDRFDPGTEHFTNYTHDSEDPESISDPIVYSLAGEADGDLWVGTQIGLNRLDRHSEKFTHYFHDPADNTSISQSHISLLYIDRAGELWVGTFNNGLNRFIDSSNSFQRWIREPGNRNSLSHNSILALYEQAWGGSSDSQQTRKLWIGTNGGGLNSLDIDSGEIVHHQMSDGLASNFVFGIAADDEGNLWLNNKDAITCFNPQLNTFQIYGAADGLAGISLNSSASWTSIENNRIYFGGAGGCIIFNPSNMPQRSNPSPVVFTDFRVFNQSVIPGAESPLNRVINFADNINLSHRDYVFSFQFATLDYSGAEQTRYACMMEGFHDEWIDLDNKRDFTFTDLEPGDYLFRVKGINSHGVWNDTQAAMPLSIAPPPWRSWWAYLIYAASAVSIITFMRQYDINRTRVAARLGESLLRAESAELRARALEAESEVEKQQIRARIASDLHDEIGSNLSSISLLSEMSANSGELSADIKSQLIEIHRAAKLSTTAIRDIVWFINPMSDRVDDLITRMRETSKTMLNQLSVEFTKVNDQSVMQLNPDKKRHIYLIYKEVLTNIVKHSQATEAIISLMIEAGSLSLVIDDNGSGYDAQSVYAGNGLRNMRNRAEQIGGILSITSSAGRGTKTRLRVRL